MEHFYFLRLVLVEVGGDQHVAEDLLEGRGHLLLLGDAAVVLDGEDDGVFAGHEGVVLDDFDDVQEPDLAGDGVAVEYERHPVRPVPAVQLDTSGERFNILVSISLEFYQQLSLYRI